MNIIDKNKNLMLAMWLSFGKILSRLLKFMS